MAKSDTFVPGAIVRVFLFIVAVIWRIDSKIMIYQ